MKPYQFFTDRLSTDRFSTRLLFALVLSLAPGFALALSPQAQPQTTAAATHPPGAAIASGH